VYGLSTESAQQGFGMEQQARDYYTQRSSLHYETLKNYGVTHMLTYASHWLPGKEPVLENAFYKVYEL
jgi:hypothetical protein